MRNGFRRGRASSCSTSRRKGVDVGARAQVYSAIAEAAKLGAAALCASSDYEQLTAICDRVIVFARGRAVKQLVGR